jgi:hypothetical protein
MSKKKVHKLTSAGAVPYKLIGISSHENDYRLSWAANMQLGLNFRKTDNFLPRQSTDELEFSVFQFTDEDCSCKLNLISNRCPDGFLIKELKNIDFFLQIFGETPRSYIDEIITGLKKIDIVSAVFEIGPEKQKKTWNFPPE